MAEISCPASPGSKAKASPLGLGLGLSGRTFALLMCEALGLIPQHHKNKQKISPLDSHNAHTGEEVTTGM
jgi:hypothetical protein